MKLFCIHISWTLHKSNCLVIRKFRWVDLNILRPVQRVVIKACFRSFSQCKFSYVTEKHFLKVNLNASINSSTTGYRLFIEFNGKLTESIVGFYRSEYTDAQNNKRWVDNTNQCLTRTSALRMNNRKIKAILSNDHPLESMLSIPIANIENRLIEIIHICRSCHMTKIMPATVYLTLSRWSVQDFIVEHQLKCTANVMNGQSSKHKSAKCTIPVHYIHYLNDMGS